MIERIGPSRLSEPSVVDVVDRLEPLRDDWCRLTESGANIFATWEWNDLQWYYGAEISALPLNDNAVDLTVTPSSNGGRGESGAGEPEGNHA